ncbi:MAG TPA: FkbM family methyltransferase [Thermoleophilaceae bacterium]|nr:FkbM family methyltransferase [Thermoleophilaceae bacterium]
MRAELREKLRLGRAGPVSRRVARAITRTAPVRRVDWVAYAVIGRPRGHAEPVVARRYGARFALSLADDIDRLLYLDTYERLALKHTLAVVERGDVVVDVGANIGLYSLASAARGATVRSFEPVPPTADRFERNLALNPDFTGRVRLTRAAVSDAPGELTLHAESFESYSGHASAYTIAPEGADSVTVPTVTLDDELADVEGPVKLMKIDVEGHEPAVLRGAGASFERLRPEYLLVEAEDDHLRAGGSSADELLRQVQELGYRELGGYTLHSGLWPHTSPEVVDLPLPRGIAQSVLFRRAS